MSKKQSKAVRPKGFDDEWLQIDEFKDWLRKVDDDHNKYRCRQTCYHLQVKLRSQNMQKGRSTKKLLKERKVFFSPQRKEDIDESSRQGSLEETGHVKDISIIKAQVIWILKMIDIGYGPMCSG